MNNKILIDKFNKKLSFSKKIFINRLVNKPIDTIHKVLFSRFYKYIIKNKTYFIKGRFFWGSRMLMVLPEDASLYHWGLVPGEEESLTNFMLENINVNDIVIDIGANHGYYSALISEIVGQAGKVYCFEPTPSTIKILKENTENKKNVKIIEKAIWSNREILEFTDYGQGYSAYNTFFPNSGAVQIDAENLGNKKIIKVEAIDLDSYLSENNIIPNFIKLDVEGAELEALHGMLNTLIKHKPIITVEFLVNKLWNQKNDKILSFFNENNFSAYFLEKNRKVPYSKNTIFKHEYTNLLFIANK